MFSLSRPLGRLSFFAGLCAVNTAIIVTAGIALAMLPASGAGMALLVVMTALQAVWLVLHARRFADAGRGPGWPLAFALTGFAVFAVGYLVSASLWSVPEVQQEAFRTAGGIGGGLRDTVETNPLLLDAGRALASILGAAGAVVVTGLIFILFLIVAAASAVFSTVALILPSRMSWSAPPLPDRTASRILR